jgi:hypothetical protein
MVRTLQQHIQDNYNELDLFTVNNQRRRHLESELECLERYYKNHPDQDKDPNSLELYCDSNPEAPECRIYE